jgi:hypothetical protein
VSESWWGLMWTLFWNDDAVLLHSGESHRCTTVCCRVQIKEWIQCVVRYAIKEFLNPLIPTTKTGHHTLCCTIHH